MSEFTVTDHYLSHATFGEFRDALASAQTGMTEKDLDFVMVSIWGKIMMKRMGVTI